MGSDLFPVGLGEPLMRHAAGDGSAYSFRDDVLAIYGEDERHLVTVHEITHFLEHCSTPIGLFRDECHYREFICARGFFEEYSGAIYAPIYDWVRTYRRAPESVPAPVDNTQFDSLIGRYLRPWSASAHLSQVIEGHDHIEVRSVTEGDAINLLHLVEQPTSAGAPGFLASVSERYLPVLAGNETTSHLACPMRNVQTTTGAQLTPIGGEHVSELIAQIQEGFERIDPERVSPVYTILAQQAFESYGVARLGSIPDGDKRIPRTCLAIADLALFSPIGSIYKKIRKPHTYWKDIHPGHRFLAALAVVAQQGRWISELSEAEPLADAICEHLGWVRPRLFLELGAMQTHDRLARHRAACQLRLEHFAAPYQLDHPEIGPAAGRLFSDHMPIVHYPGYGVVCPVPEGDTQNRTALLKLRDCFLTRLFWYSLRQRWTGPLTDYLLPQPLKLTTYFDLESPEEFVSLVTHRYPWAAPARIASLRPQ